MNDIAQVISTIGFPIFSFLMAGFALKYVYDRERKSLDTTIEKLSDLTNAVNHNSEVLSRVVAELNVRGDSDVHSASAQT